MGGGGGHGQREHEVKVDGVRTEYLYNRSSSSHHSMSLDFEYADEYVDISLSAGSHGSSSQSSGEVLLPDGRTIETTNRSAGGGSHSDLVVTVFLPFGGQTQTYTSETHTSNSWSLGGDFSMGLSRDAWGNITRHSPEIAAFTRTDTNTSSSTRTDATGTSTSDSENVTTTTGGGGGNSLNQNWTSESSWSFTPAPPSGGGGSGGGSGRGSGGGGGDPTGGSSGGGGGGAVDDVSGYLTGQIDSGTPGTNVSPGQALQSLYDYLAGLYGPDPAAWPEELRERLFGHDHEDGYVNGASSQGWFEYSWLTDLYNGLYSNRPGTEGTPVDVRPIEEIGSGGGEGDPTAYQPFGHGAASPALVERAPTNEGSGSGSGSESGGGGGEEELRYVDGMLLPVYLDHVGYFSLLAQRQRVREVAHDTSVPDVIRKNHWFLLSDLNGQINAIEDKIGKATGGASREPYKDYSFGTKLGGALRRAINSGEMDDAVAEKLEEIANPESLAILAGSMAAYGALHGTPAAPALAVFDAYFLASGGTEAALAMQRIYLAVDSATTEQEMDAAAGTIIAELSGPAADAILNALIWGAGRGIAKVGSRLEVDPNSLGMNGGNIRKKLDEAAGTVGVVPSVRNGDFYRWFDNLTLDELEQLWKDPVTRTRIEARLRSPGGFHEWLPVSRAVQFKEWGITAEQIHQLRTLTRDVRFLPTGRHGGFMSGTAHNEIIRLVDDSPDFATFVNKLREWAETRLVGGAAALPEGLRP